MGFEPARQRYIASQKPNTLPTELSGRPINNVMTTRVLSLLAGTSNVMTTSVTKMENFTEINKF